ncbi:MAG: hypothetical protein ABL924_08845 [Methyloglobulus sp.]
MLPNGLGLEAIEIWFQGEPRVGQRGTLTRIWAAVPGRLRVWGGLPRRGQGRRTGHAQSQ